MLGVPQKTRLNSKEVAMNVLNVFWIRGTYSIVRVKTFCPPPLTAGALVTCFYLTNPYELFPLLFQNIKLCCFGGLKDGQVLGWWELYIN